MLCTCQSRGMHVQLFAPPSLIYTMYSVVVVALAFLCLYFITPMYIVAVSCIMYIVAVSCIMYTLQTWPVSTYTLLNSVNMALLHII